MAKIKIRSLIAAAHGGADAAETIAGDVVTSGVFAAPDDPIHLRLHRMGAGARLTWSGSGSGHLAYVWEGALSCNGLSLARGSVIVVEHAASLMAEAGPEGAALIVFNAAGAHAAPSKPGARLHIMPADRVPAIAGMGPDRAVGVALYADSECPTCDLWLHANMFHRGDYEVAPHYHSEDEMIVVTAGEIVLGDRGHGVGTAIAIARNTIYGFRTGSSGLSFLNFRARRPSYGLAGADPVDERHFYKLSAPGATL